MSESNVVSFDDAVKQRHTEIERQEKAFEQYLIELFWEECWLATQDGHISMTSYEIIYRSAKEYFGLPDSEPEEPDGDY